MPTDYPGPVSRIFARGSRVGHEQLLSGSDGDGQPVLAGRDGAAPGRVVRAIRVVRGVEVDHHMAVLPWAFHIEVAAGAVRVLAARGIAERQEQLVHVG